MTREDKIFNRVHDYLETDVSPADLVSINNEYCQKINDMESYIYYMEELDDFMIGMSPTEILEAVDSDFTTSDRFFKDGIYGMESTSSPEDWMDFDDIAQYVADWEVTLLDDGIKEILDSCDDDEEESEDEDR